MAIDFNANAGMFRTIDSIEIETNDQSMEDGILDYIVSGGIGAVAAAGVSLYNTVHALGETLGLADSDGRATTSEFLQEYVGDDIADFYNRHSEGVEFAGLIVGSILPGMAAVKALRAAQVRGVLAPAMEATTGLKNVDLVLDSAAVTTAKQSVLRGAATSGFRNQQMYKAYAAGAKQQVLENLAFEAGVLATMNQSPTLNPEGMGYFDAMATQAVEGIPFLAGGMVLGSGVEVLRIRGAVRKFVNSEYERTGQYLAPTVEELVGLTPGEKVTYLAMEKLRHGGLEATIAEGDTFAQSQFRNGQKAIQDMLLESMGELNFAGEGVRKNLEQLVNNITEDQIPFLGQLLAGASRMENVTLEQWRGLKQFYNNTATPTNIYSGSRDALYQQVRTAMNDRVQYAKDTFGTEWESALLGNTPRSSLTRTDELGILDGMKFLVNTSLRQGDRGTAVRAIADLAEENPRGLATNRPFVIQFDNSSSSWVPVPTSQAVINDDAIRTGVDITNEYRKSAGLKPMTFEEMKQVTTLHELSHIKSNPVKMQEWVNSKFTVAATDPVAENSLRELVKLSINSRPEHYINNVSGLKRLINAQNQTGALADTIRNVNENNLDELLDFYVNTVIKDNNLQEFGNIGYLISPKELLADAGAQLVNPATRERASKIAPTVARIFNENGAIARAWDDTHAYWNTRTGETLSSALPGLVDLDDKVKYIVDRNGKVGAKSGVLGKTFGPNGLKAFRVDSYIKPGSETLKKLDYMEADALWAAYDNVPLKKLINKNGEIIVDETNLPLAEKILAAFDSTDQALANQVLDLEIGGKIKYRQDNGFVSNIDYATLKRNVIQKKIELRDAMALHGQYNENEIAKALNIELDNAMGKQSADGWILYGTKSFQQPELISVSYKPMSMGDAELSTKSIEAVKARSDQLRMLREKTSAGILGDLFNVLPDNLMDKILAMSPLESRTGMLHTARNAFGSARAQMAYIGKLVHQKIENVSQDVAGSFQKYHSKFNNAQNRQLRMELANVDQIIRRERYVLTLGDDGQNYLVQKKQVEQFVRNNAANEAEFNALMEQFMDWNVPLPSAVTKDMVGAGNKFSPNAIALSDDVAEFYAMHRSRNAALVEKKIDMAGALGKTSVLDPNIIYPPPRNLRQTPYFAFVTPGAFTEGSDPRKFMIFAETAEEYEAKVSAIKNKYGNQYNIVTKKDVELYKRYTGEYDQGLVFDEIDFDASMYRRGSASELVPNQDIQTSGTLNRYHDWHTNQEQALIRGAVELKYAQEFQTLRAIDGVVTNVERSKLTGRGNTTSIWEDSRRLMVDVKPGISEIQNLFVRVNDYIGQQGSKIIDDAFGIFRRSPRVTQESLDQFNRELEKNGYQAPLRDAMELILTSPDTNVSRALPNLVRTMNNLTSSFMLRLDFAHSFIQTVSTPILTLPVVMEAKEALRGSRAGQVLENATSVINPINGLPEPSSAKLIAAGYKKYFSEDGRAFLQQLRERGIVNDYLEQYLDAMDMRQINGQHTLEVVNEKINQLTKFGSTFSGFKHSEELGRFVVANAIWEIGKLRGIPAEELWGEVSSAVDKVHGIYLNHQRPQLFQGVIGQAIGLYQTYFFNFAQNAMKWVSDGNRKQLAALVGMQGSIFGMGSFPGFTTLNRLVGETNQDNNDLFTYTNSDKPDGWGQYFMYGAASHALGFPMDFFSRGDLAVRHSLVVPTNPQDIPAISILTKAVSNMYNVGTMVLDTNDGVSATQALIHGLAHNGMNRPLQGLGTIIQGQVTSGRGQAYFQNSNYVDYNAAEEINWAAGFARLLGTKPLNESILMSSYFRTNAYQNKARQDAANLGERVQLSLQGGTYDSEAVNGFYDDYVGSGGDPQNFNAFIMRHMKSAREGAITEFQRQQLLDERVKRKYRQLQLRQSMDTPITQSLMPTGNPPSIVDDARADAEPIETDL